MKTTLAIVFTFLCWQAYAQVDPQLSGAKVMELSSNLERALEKVDNIEFETTSNVIETDIHRDITKQFRSTHNGLKVASHFVGEGTQYFYSQRMSDAATGDMIESSERAFDGQNFQRFDPTTGALLLEKKDQLGYHLRMGFYSPLHMFGFFMPAIPGPEATITWSGLKTPSFWKMILGSARILGEEVYNGQTCLVVKIPGGESRLFDVPCTYTIYFSKQDGFFPIGWKSETLQGRLLEDYTVNELGKIDVAGVPFFYPKKATDRCYTAAGYPAGEPQLITTIETAAFKINTADQNAFTIDPLKAKMVVDQDEQVAIPVPK